jgi:phosphoglycerate kinase
MSSLRTLADLFENHDISGKRVMMRADFNVPMAGVKVADMARINRTLPTINALIAKGAKLVIISHFGRPTGEFNPDLSMAPIADALSGALGGKYIKFGVDCIGSRAHEAVESLESGEIVLLENLRFHDGEKENDPYFVDSLAELADFFVNDAFSVSHRAHASIVGLTEKMPSYAGLLVESEIKHLESVLTVPERPLVAIVGGSKVSTKIDLLENLVSKVDYLCVGGGMANTFLHAQGHDVGKSLCEKDLKDTALNIFEEAKKHGCEILLPIDMILADELKENARCNVVDLDHDVGDRMILDIGPRTVHAWASKIEQSKTLVWNGPLGCFETTPFDVGTISLSRVVSGLTDGGNIQSIAGGGDILAALQRGGLRGTFSYISTAGGAFLEWMEGKDLPGVAALKK